MDPATRRPTDRPAVNLYVVLGAPPLGNLAVVHHEEISLPEYERLRADYDPAALDEAIAVARDWLDRALGDRECRGLRHDGGAADGADRDGDDGPDGDLPSDDEVAALQVLLGCLAAAARDAVADGDRWALIDVRYYDDEAHVTVACRSSPPEFAFTAPAGHA